jgi:hypothetical protein
MVTPEQRLIAWLLQDRRRYQDRCGPPTLDDIRACGVERKHVREYLRKTGWSCDSADVGDCRPGAWQEGPPTWSHEQYPAQTLSIRHDDQAIRFLSRLERRSGWAVLDDIAHLVGPRTVYLPDDKPAAIVWGPHVSEHPRVDKSRIPG